MTFGKIFQAALVSDHCQWFTDTNLFLSRICRKDLRRNLVRTYNVSNVGFHKRADFIGTLRFTYDGQRIGKDDTPGGVCFVPEN